MKVKSKIEVRLVRFAHQCFIIPTFGVTYNFRGVGIAFAWFVFGCAITCEKGVEI